MGDTLIMAKKERHRKTILDQVIARFISQKDGRKRLGISKRQFIRIMARYKREGDAGLVHKNRGKMPGCAYPVHVKNKMLSIYQDKYPDFGPTLAAEKLLEEDNLQVHAETLRLWLKAAGIWKTARKRKPHRSRRARRARFGELLQLDGSIHAWFSGIDAKQCLMNMVDDATGKTLAILDNGETTRAAFALLRWWITEAGIPMAVYVDLKSLYVSPKSLRYDAEDELVEPDWLTHFSCACKKLGIEVIKAYSAQAKGRVERNHAVYQDRFVKELKLKDITNIKAANHLLSSGFINKLNNKFAKPANDSQDAHVPLRADNDLDQILCWEFTRVVHNDWTIRFENQFLQIEKCQSQIVKPKQKVTVRRHLDDTISLWYKEQCLYFYFIDKRSDKEKLETTKKALSSLVRSKISRQNRHKTPWGKFNPNWLNSSKRIKNNGVTA